MLSDIQRKLSVFAVPILAATLGVAACDRSPETAGQPNEVPTADRPSAAAPPEMGSETTDPETGANSDRDNNPGATSNTPSEAVPPPEQLKQFASAYTKVQALNRKYAAKISAVSDPQKAQEIQRQASSEMAEAVSKAGLTGDEYSKIAMQVEKDAELAKRVIAHMNKQ